MGVDLAGVLRALAPAQQPGVYALQREFAARRRALRALARACAALSALVVVFFVVKIFVLVVFVFFLGFQRRDQVGHFDGHLGAVAALPAARACACSSVSTVSTPLAMGMPVSREMRVIAVAISLLTTSK